MSRLIYVPPGHTHDCETRFWGHDTPRGTIARCSDCGRDWYLTSEANGCDLPPTYCWKPVRWWHFRRRYLIEIHQPIAGRQQGPH